MSKIDLDALSIREAAGGITIRGEFLAGLAVTDVSIVDGGIQLARLPEGAVIADFRSRPDVRNRLSMLKAALSRAN